MKQNILNQEILPREDLQDGREVRRGKHLPPYKYIKNTSTCGITPTEHLLKIWQKTSDFPKGKKTPMHLGWAKEKRKNRDKTIGMGPVLLGGSCEEGKVSTH